VIAYRQAHRTAWLASVLHTQRSVSFPQYQRKFHVTDRTYYHDLTVLAEVNIIVESRRDHGRIDLVKSP
jgi:predicted DNA-binding transcriptional regulator YafY